MAIFRDRSSVKRAEEERRHIEQRMLEAQRLESLGVLAGGIAHDFNNLLTVILGNASFARDEVADDSEASEPLDNISQAAERGAALCAAMLAYAGKGRHARTRLDLHQFVQESVNLLRISVARTIHLVLDLDPTIPRVEVDPSQLQQVLMNLVINAADAIGTTPGTITVRTSVEEVDGTAVRSSLVAGEIVPGRYAVVEVRDDGPGMSTTVLSRIFDPFFTTKATGRGLGLAAVRGIVAQNGAALTVTSPEERGTTFRLFLKPTDGSVTTVEATKTEWSSEGTVLVVDDEPAVRAAAALLLRRIGFEVVAVASASEGLAAMEPEPSTFRLLVTDLTMPEMGGLELVSRVHALAPGFPTVVMSGWSADDASTALAQFEGVAFLQKPFSLGAMTAAVQSALERGEAPAA